MNRPAAVRAFVLLLATASLAPVAAAAQAPLAPGAVVRWFDAPSQTEVQGTVRTVTADSIAVVIGSGSRSTSIPASIRSLEVRDGRRGGLHGAGLGFLVGAGGGAAIGYVIGQDCRGHSLGQLFCFSHGQVAVLFALPSAVLGAVVAGLTDEPWRWRIVNPANSARQIIVEPLIAWHHGLVAGLTARF